MKTSSDRFPALRLIVACMNAYNAMRLTKAGAPIHVKIRRAKNSPDAPAKASDSRTFFSEEIFFRDVREMDPSLADFKASMKNA